MKTIPRILAGLLALLVGVGSPSAWAAAPAETAQAAELTEPQLENLVAPVALYPDGVLSQILVASTYPLEIVQAEQWLQQHPDLKGAELTNAAKTQSWDPSVQALTAFPEVLKRLSGDVTWTTNLGNAFLARETDVMDAVQRLRQRAQDEGKLTSTAEQKVTDSEDNGRRVVQIEPVQPDVVYVPVYDPAWYWGPAVWYPYPYWCAPPVMGVHLWFGAPIVLSAAFIGWGPAWGWGWHPYWGRRVVVVNNVFIERNHFWRGPAVVAARPTAVWHHDTVHRAGVVYPNRVLANHYSAPVRAARPTAFQVRENFRNWSATHNWSNRWGAARATGTSVRAAAPNGGARVERTAGSSQGHGGGHRAWSGGGERGDAGRATGGGESRSWGGGRGDGGGDGNGERSGGWGHWGGWGRGRR